MPQGSRHLSERCSTVWCFMDPACHDRLFNHSGFVDVCVKKNRGRLKRHFLIHSLGSGQICISQRSQVCSRAVILQRFSSGGVCCATATVDVSGFGDQAVEQRSRGGETGADDAERLLDYGPYGGGSNGVGNVDRIDLVEGCHAYNGGNASTKG